MKKYYLILLCACLFNKVFAQKLPDIQLTSLAAPKAIKVDGKSTEWNDAYAAENKRTALLYTIANDDKNLYLIVKCGNSANINKIMLGGITFTINSEGKKRDKEGTSVTYPLIDRTNRNSGGRLGQQGSNRREGGGNFQNRSEQTTTQRDSVVLVTRKAQLASVKEIKISGFKTIQDTLISIYNEHGIKAASNINPKGEFVCEFAIPLMLLELGGKTELAYQLKLNGMANMNFGGNNGGGRSFGGGGNFGGGRNGGNDNNSQDLMSPTDFWGKYILFKN